MGKLKMATANLNAPDFLPNRLIAFMKANAADLFSRFHARYAPDVSNPVVFTELQAQLSDDGLYSNLRRVFQRQQQEYQDVRQRRQDIDKIIRERYLAVGDPERDKLEADKKALAGLRKRFDQRQILEYLTNAGLLPNYAFPETGVTLDAWVRMARVKGSEGLPGAPIPYEIVRPASVALRELAPDNFFYAQGHKFKISGLNTFDWTDPATLLHKRFCSSCDHLADMLPSAAPEPYCPKCQDPSWASSRNLHTFVRLNGVKSANSREDAALDDSSDDRDNVRYRTSRHLHFHPDSFQGAWGMKTIPFGIEYVKQVDITDVNLGNAEVNDANRIEINTHEEIPHHGFVTCRHCGKSTTAPQQVLRDDQARFHYGYCRYLDRDYAGVSDEVFAEVFLFRTVRTEALKILLPVQEFEADATIAMFEAGLQTGLRRYYQGSPAHIGFIHYREHNPATGRFDRYLVLFDQIPGGTGYLEKLFQPSEFTQLLTLAYAAIRECECQYQGKDGCYRCVYSYLNQRSHPELSRRRAEELFGRIVASANSWEPFTSGLSGVSGTGQIEESELEERFIRSLRKAFKYRVGDGWQMEDFVENGAVHHRLRLPSGEYVFDYVIRKQVPLGPTDNVKLNTRPDFYISASAVQKNGHSVADPAVVESIRHIAVYLDGYTYHATAQHMRFFTDVERRAAINAAPDKTTWTLSWADLDKFDADEDNPARQDTLWLDQSKFKSALDKYRTFPYWNSYRSGLLDTSNSMERLLWMLATPLAAQHPRQKISLLLSQFQPKFGIPSYGATELENALRFLGELDPNARAQANPFYIKPALHQPNNLYETRTLIGVKDLDLHSASRLQPTATDLDKPAWEAFWQLYNLLQMHHQVVSNTPSEAPTGDDIGSSEPEKAEILACFDDDLHPLIQQLLAHGISFGQEGSFFLMQSGKFTAEAALGFEAAKVFVNPLSLADKQAFEAAGYHEVAPADFTLDMVTL
jgi:DEAD/DEAH box helicase domain-containing protein